MRYPVRWAWPPEAERRRLAHPPPESSPAGLVLLLERALRRRAHPRLFREFRSAGRKVRRERASSRSEFSAASVDVHILDDAADHAVGTWQVRFQAGLDRSEQSQKLTENHVQYRTIKIGNGIQRLGRHHEIGFGSQGFGLGKRRRLACAPGLCCQSPAADRLHTAGVAAGSKSAPQIMFRDRVQPSVHGAAPALAGSWSALCLQSVPEP